MADLELIRSAEDVVRGCEAQIEIIADQELRQGKLLEGFRLRRELDQLTQTIWENPSVFFVGRRMSPKPFSPRHVKETLEFGDMTVSERTDSILPRYVLHTFQRDRHTMLLGRPPIMLSPDACAPMLANRRDAPLPLDANWNIAMTGIGLLALMVVPVSQFPERAMAVPLRDGVLFGHVTTEYDGEPACDVAFNRATEMSSAGLQDYPSMTSTLCVDPNSQDLWIFHATSYVLLADLNAEQRIMHEKLIAFVKGLGSVLNLIGLSALFPQHGDCQENMRPASGMMARVERAISAMGELLVSPGMAEAMGNSGGTPSRLILGSAECQVDPRSEIVNELIRNLGGKPQGLR